MLMGRSGFACGALWCCSRPLKRSTQVTARRVSRTKVVVKFGNIPNAAAPSCVPKRFSGTCLSGGFRSHVVCLSTVILSSLAMPCSYCAAPVP